MNFLTPLFLSLAALSVPIIILYMLRLRRREVQVSSTMLWQRLMQDREANTPWQKLRRNLLLLLQLLILLALVIALARPFVKVPSVAVGSVALLIDASASMNADDMPGGATRFEAAQAQARELVGELASDNVMTVIAVGPTPEVLIPPTSERALLRDAIGRARPTQAPADWEAALALAGASIAGREDAVIVILSDGGLPAELPSVPAEVQYIQLGRSADNLAISALATRPSGDVPQLFAAVSNYGEQDADVILSIEVDGELHTAERLSIPAGQTTDITLTDLPETLSVIRAELTEPVEGGEPDFLPVDDVAYAAYQPPVGGKTLLVTEGSLFLEQLLAALPAIEAYKAPPGEMPEETFDLIIFDRWLPEGDLPDTNLLIIAPDHTSNLFVIGESFEETRFLRQADSPILSFVEFKDIAVREAITVDAPGWAQVLVEAEGGPLLLAGSIGGRRVAIITFDLHASDIALRVDFPILMANLFEWFAPSRAFDAQNGLYPGEPLLIHPGPFTDRYHITLPDGSDETYPVEEEALSFTHTHQLGLYDVSLMTGNNVQGGGQFAVNLFAPHESTIAPVDRIIIGQTEIEGTQEGEDTGQRELWPWLAGLAVAVLVIEWWVFHRGSALPRRQLNRRERAS